MRPGGGEVLHDQSSFQDTALPNVATVNSQVVHNHEPPRARVVRRGHFCVLSPAARAMDCNRPMQLGLHCSSMLEGAGQPIKLVCNRYTSQRNFLAFCNPSHINDPCSKIPNYRMRAGGKASQGDG